VIAAGRLSAALPCAAWSAESVGLAMTGAFAAALAPAAEAHAVA
jgi:hypothetical protein